MTILLLILIYLALGAQLAAHCDYDGVLDPRERLYPAHLVAAVILLPFIWLGVGLAWALHKHHRRIKAGL